MFGKTRRDGLREALSVTFDSDEKHNCAHIELRGTDAAIQYRTDVEYINVAPLTDAELKTIRNQFDRSVEDSGNRYIVFERDAATVVGAVEEIQAAAAALDSEEITRTQTFRAGEPAIISRIRQVLQRR